MNKSLIQKLNEPAPNTAFVWTDLCKEVTFLTLALYIQYAGDCQDKKWALTVYLALKSLENLVSFSGLAIHKPHFNTLSFHDMSTARNVSGAYATSF